MTTEEEVVSVRFCIPALGTEIILAKPWKFTLWDEHRNSSMIKAIGDLSGGKSDVTGVTSHGEITIPKDTRLRVDRIYIRQGVQDYNSVTFRIKKKGCPGNPKLEKTRFGPS